MDHNEIIDMQDIWNVGLVGVMIHSLKTTDLRVLGESRNAKPTSYTWGYNLSVHRGWEEGFRSEANPSIQTWCHVPANVLPERKVLTAKKC